MNIILTGSEGFIGSAVSHALTNKGHIVYGIDKRNKAYPIDIADGRQLGEHIESLPRPDMILHFAGSCSTQRGIDDPQQDFKDNVLASFNIVNTAKYYGVPIIYASSCKAHPVKGVRTPYGLSKYIGEQYCVEYNACYDVPFIANRMGTIYGPGQLGSPESGWIAWFVKCALEGKELTIYGDGEQVRDILFIDDVVKLYVDQVENFEKYQGVVFDVGGGVENAVSLNQMKGHLGIKKVKYDKPRVGDSRAWISLNYAISRVNDWVPETSWQHGILKTLDYYKQ